MIDNLIRKDEIIIAIFSSYNIKKLKKTIINSKNYNIPVIIIKCNNT